MRPQGSREAFVLQPSLWRSKDPGGRVPASEAAHPGPPQPHRTNVPALGTSLFRVLRWITHVSPEIAELQTSR